jgi:hypothetical protein
MFKGAPEFEVHVMGQKGSTDSLETEQCAGESAGSPYAFNMDNTTWTGSVMLMSQAQLNSYRAAHPNKALRILFLEDDQDQCVLRLDATKVTDIISDIESVLGSQTGAKDSVSGVVKIIKKAPRYIKRFSAVYNFLQSQDEFVGNAVQDSVAGQFYPGANWILKGENTAVHGYLKLEMR